MCHDAAAQSTVGSAERDAGGAEVAPIEKDPSVALTRPARLVPFAAVALMGTTALLGAACTAERSPGALGEPASRLVCDDAGLVDEPLLDAGPAAPQSASYSNEADAPQSKDCAGMRRFLSTPQPGFDLQSFVFYGHLIDDSGKVIAFSTLSQDSNVATGSGSGSSVIQMDSVSINAGSGTTLGGMEGAPDVSDQLSWTSNPWSVRSQTFTAGSAPQYIDARVVQGQLGQAGAVIELTAQLQGVDTATASATAEPMQVSVRLRDVAGVGEWGYGPSGFFPQWIYPAQRSSIMEDHGGSVEDYLQATNEPMTNQGSYYYSSPVVEVERFTITRGSSVVFHGTKGELLLDYVTQSFDAKAKAIVDSGVTWTEFSVLFDDERSMKLGEVHQSSVGTLPYAVLLSADGERLANGSLTPSQRWSIGDIELAPDAASTWTSPRSKKTYSTRYTAELMSTAGAGSAELTLTAVYDDQELSVAGRTVYEGVFEVTGIIDGESVSGYAWAEIQPSGTL